MTRTDPHSSPSGAVLVILHQEHSCPARVGRLLHTMGYSLDMRRPRYGDPLPETLRDHAGAIIFGGPMSANDPDDYVRREIEFVDLALKEDKPLLGLCLGAQMLARSLGQTVRPHEAGAAEIGYYPIEATEAGHALCAAPFPDYVYQWHREGFDVPHGAELLARGDIFPNQAFRYGKAIGLQFHPEVTYATICRWTTRSADRMEAPHAQPRRAHMEGWYRHDAAVARWTDSFLHCWIGRGEGLLTKATNATPPVAFAEAAIP